MNSNCMQGHFHVFLAFWFSDLFRVTMATTEATSNNVLPLVLPVTQPISNDPKTLLTCVDKLLKDLKTWSSPIVFPILWKENPHSAWTFEVIDINSKLADYACANSKFYFDTNRYPANDEASWTTLTCELQKVFHESGATFYNAGRSRKGNTHCRLRCAHNSLFRNRSAHAAWNAQGTSGRENLNYRQESLQNSRKHARGKSGQQELPKRNVTKKALNIDEKCTASFTIYKDEVGFYFKGGQGPIQHSHHYKHASDLMSVPARFLEPNEQAILMSLANSHAGNGVCRNLCVERNSVFLSSSKIRHLHGLTGNKDRDESAFTGDDLRKQFKEHGVSFCFLYHQLEMGENSPSKFDEKSQLAGTVVNETYITSDYKDDNASVHSDCIDSSSTNEEAETAKEYQDMYSYAMSHRESFSNAIDEPIWIALAYVTPQSRRLFRMYPHVLKFDVTMGTNDEKRPLLIVSGRTPWGENFIVMRVYLPNERAWVFRWVFQMALPKLLGTEYLLLVNLAITDGDSQEFQQLDIAIHNHLKNAKRRRCSYHIIHRGWINNGPSGRGIVDQDKSPQWLNLVNVIMRWLFSWVNAGPCPTKEHYQISKALLQKFLEKSPMVKNTIATDVVQRVYKFLRENVEPHEMHYAHFKFRESLHFHDHSNSALEGLNSGMKRNSAPLRPNHSIFTSTSVHLIQNKIKVCQMAEKVNRDLICTKLWSSLPTAAGIEKKGETLIRQDWNRRNDYICFRIESHEWRVRKKTRSKVDPSDPIPRFDPVHIVKVNPCERIMLCSCGYFRSCGLPCVHQMTVASAMNPFFPGFATSDVHVVWWSTYHNYGERPDEHPEITMLFRQLLKDGIKGPTIPEVPENYFESWSRTQEIPLEFMVKPPHECCLNYNLLEIKNAVDCFQTFGVAFGVEKNAANEDVNEEEGNYFDYTDDHEFEYEVNNNLEHSDNNNLEPAAHQHDQQIGRMSFLPKKERPVYFQVMPIVKEWINLMDDYHNGDKFVECLKQHIERDIAEVKAAREEEKKGLRKRQGMRSICVATDKRRRLQITKNMLR